MHWVWGTLQGPPIFATVQERFFHCFVFVWEFLFWVSDLVILVSASWSKRPDKVSDNQRESTKKITFLWLLQEKPRNKSSSALRRQFQGWMSFSHLPKLRASTKISLKRLWFYPKTSKRLKKSRLRLQNCQETWKFTLSSSMKSTAPWALLISVFCTMDKLQWKRPPANFQRLSLTVWAMSERTWNTFSTATVRLWTYQQTTTDTRSFWVVLQWPRPNWLTF